MKKKRIVVILIVVMVFCILLYEHRPIIAERITGQTLYLTLLNFFHVKENNAEARFMIIDDDSGHGIYKIHELCEKVGMKATFAVGPAFLDSARIDSLKKWQREGYGLAFHGYDHGCWKNWSKIEILNDIEKSIDYLKKSGFYDVDKINLVVTPSFYNTTSIRNAIRSKGMKMIVGGDIVNPDTTAFIWGRVFIRRNSDLEQIRSPLIRAKERNDFVIIGTHSSIDDEFDAEKMEQVLKMAKTIGFKYVE